jgi:hypothetical protein
LASTKSVTALYRRRCRNASSVAGMNEVTP